MRYARRRMRAVVVASTLVLFVGCKEKAGEKPGEEPAAQNEGAPASAPASAPATAWVIDIVTFDQNGNDALDTEERKPGPVYGYTALALATGGGPCTLEKKDATLKGSCGPTTENGKKALRIEPEPASGEMPATYLVLSESDSELVLKDPTGKQGTIYVYKRR
jgi:hypothetical protein